MYGEEDVTASYERLSARFAGNTFEQSPIFLTGLWLYTLFVDYGSAYSMGMLYIVFRILYPLFYIVCHEFSFWFELNTQTGYGCNGVFILGCAMTGMGMDYVAFATGSPYTAALLSFAAGSFAFIPGLPLAPLYALLWYKRDNSFAKASAGLH